MQKQEACALQEAVLHEYDLHRVLNPLLQREFVPVLAPQLNLQQPLYLDLYELLLVLLFVGDQVLLEVKPSLCVLDVNLVYGELLLVGEL